MTIRQSSVIVLSSILFVSLINTAFAVEQVDGLYEARVPISERTSSARDQAMQAGLIDVLVALSGYSGLRNYPQLKSLAENPNGYVLDFGVETDDSVATDGVSVNPQTILHVNYNPTLVDNIVKQLQLPIWSSLRPSVGYLVLTDFGKNTPEILQLESHPAYYSVLRQALRRRGLPAIDSATVLDAAIQQQGNRSSSMFANLLWHHDTLELQEIAQLANVDLLLVLRSHVESVSLALWDLKALSSSVERDYRSADPSVDRAIAAMVDQYVDDYAKQFSFQANVGQGSDIQLQVQGINQYQQLRAVQRMLDDLEIVTAHQLTQVQNDIMYFQLSLASGVKRFQELVEQLNVIEPVLGGNLQVPFTGEENLPVDNLLYRIPGSYNSSVIPSGISQPVPMRNIFAKPIPNVLQPPSAEEGEAAAINTSELMTDNNKDKTLDSHSSQ